MKECATSCIHSKRDKSSSKLRLLTFEIRGRVRQCFGRGWSRRGKRVSDEAYAIPERCVKYHIPEYEPLPSYARAVTWKNHCENKRSGVGEHDCRILICIRENRGICTVTTSFNYCLHPPMQLLLSFRTPLITSDTTPARRTSQLDY